MKGERKKKGGEIFPIVFFFRCAGRKKKLVKITLIQKCEKILNEEGFPPMLKYAFLFLQRKKSTTNEKKKGKKSTPFK